MREKRSSVDYGTPRQPPIERHGMSGESRDNFEADLSKLLRSVRPTRRLRERVIIVLREAIRDPADWSVKRLAGASGMTARNLQRVLKESELPSPSEILRLARLRIIRTGLDAGKSIRSMADECGWRDPRSLRHLLDRTVT